MGEREEGRIGVEEGKMRRVESEGKRWEGICRTNVKLLPIYASVSDCTGYAYVHVHVPAGTVIFDTNNHRRN